MKFVALLSGGKDSCYSIIKATQCGHELVCLANLYPGPGFHGDEINSFMYQSAAHNVIPQMANCFEKPMVRRKIGGKPIDQTLTYTARSNLVVDDYDEVEDLCCLLIDVKVNVRNGLYIGVYFILKVDTFS